MSSEKTLRMFESIANKDSFSNYNMKLNKKFNENSLKSLIKSLKLKKQHNTTEYLDELYQKFPYEGYDQEELLIKADEEAQRKLNNQNKMKSQILSPNLNSPKTKSNITEHNRFNSYSSKKVLTEESPDPFRYNPNYNYIYKNTPSAIIAPPKSLDKKKLNERIILNKTKKYMSQANNIKMKKNNKENKTIENNDTIENSKTIEKKNNVEKNNTVEKRTINNNDNEKNATHNINNKEDAYFKELQKESLSLPLITSTNIDTKLHGRNSSTQKLNTIGTDKNNHALRFSKYLARKDNNFSGITNELSYFNYQIFSKNLKSPVNFRKMSSRKKNYIINSNSLDVPGFGQYNPKYDSIERNPTNIFISPLSHGRKNVDKKYLLIKMLGSYNKLGKEFKCVDNDKLFNDDKLIRQQLIINYNINPD